MNVKLSVSSMYSIGHSSHSWERFAELLQAHGVTAIADVRSSPYSKYCPHFSQDEIRQALRSIDVAYVFLGKELGGRPSNRTYFDGSAADYEKMAADIDFKRSLKRLIEGSREHRIAVMCSERDPLDCHRCLLVSRALLREGTDTEHILSDGSVISQRAIEEKLLALHGGGADDLFLTHEEQLNLAYKKQARRVAFSEDGDASDLQRAS